MKNESSNSHAHSKCDKTKRDPVYILEFGYFLPSSELYSKILGSPPTLFTGEDLLLYF